jgi:1-acyl-sn-glycerol-3-phosphate acyltransferase
MVLYVACMCLALPLALMPQLMLRKLHLVSRRRAEAMALGSGQFCSRWLLRLIPFCRIEAITGTAGDPESKRRWRRRPLPYPNPEPAVWVCNHVSMLDVFVLLGVDRRMRGRNRRPIKIVYWKGLEDNPITKILFKQCGFIPVQMTANGSGHDNEYDVSSFRKLLKDAKGSFRR